MAETYSKKDRNVTDEVVMEATGICKSFPGVKALSNVDVKIHRGEVVALLGENGAGKSTLIKVLSGVYQPDAGTIRMGGTEVQFNLPMEAKQAGIGVIHQELNYVASVSIAENIFIGNIPKKHGLVDYKTMYAESKKIMAEVGLDLDPKMSIGNCSVAQKQLIELAKVISNNVQVLIMDEPTSALNDVETKHLFQFIHKAAAQGVCIFYISHKLEELFEVANRVVVIRDGCVTGEIDIETATKQMLISRMVGRDLKDMYKRNRCKAGETVLEVRNLKTASLQDVSFQAKRGELFGIYGLMGSGHERIGSAVFGQDIIQGGEILVNGQRVHIRNPKDAVNAGIAYVPAERKTEGLVLNQSVAVNTMSALYSKLAPFFVNRKKDRAISEKWIRSLSKYIDEIKKFSPYIVFDYIDNGFHFNEYRYASKVIYADEIQRFNEASSHPSSLVEFFLDAFPESVVYEPVSPLEQARIIGWDFMHCHPDGTLTQEEFDDLIALLDELLTPAKNRKRRKSAKPDPNRLLHKIGLHYGPRNHNPNSPGYNEYIIEPYNTEKPGAA